MKREFYYTLENWFNNERNPLMVIGARQIGKTYIINKFCSECKLEYYYLNLEKEEWLYNIFEETIDPKVILTKLEFHLEKKLDLTNLILFFDEVQVSERFITSLKYFSEYETPIKIVCAGSLLGVKINRFTSSFPVGKVIQETMYPMNFKEFLIALGKEVLIDEIEKSYKSKEMLDIILHEKATDLYKKYLCIGGMPAVVQNFINNNQDIFNVNKKISQNIIDAYVADMNKYTLGYSESIKIEKVYKNIGTQLAQESKTFSYKLIEDNASKRKYEMPINWLLSSNLAYVCNLVKMPQIPLSIYKDNKSFKLYLSDVGLLNELVGLKYSDIMLDGNYMFKGALTENYVASELVNKKIDLFYWKSDATAEIDFLLHLKEGIVPCEVKSSTNNRSKSLNLFYETYKPYLKIRISQNNFGFTNNTFSIPLYAVFVLAEDLEKVL